MAPTVRGSVPVMEQGVLEPTGRGLDLAIDGEGFFAVQEFDGSTAYTRDGRLQVNADGKLVTSDGRLLLPEITFPSDTLETTIDAEGHVMVRTAGSPDVTTHLGQMQLRRFVNAPGLRVRGNLLFQSQASGAPISGNPGMTGLGLLRQRALERSNVDADAELAALRAAEQQLQALQTTLAECGVELP
jgi:flagellar basal-body rod protein FlgG